MRDVHKIEISVTVQEPNPISLTCNKGYDKVLSSFSTMTTGQKIKHYRIFLGFSQKEVANAINVSESTLSKYENDKKLVNEILLKALANFFSIPPIFFLDDSWWKTPTNSDNLQIAEETEL